MGKARKKRFTNLINIFSFSELYRVRFVGTFGSSQRTDFIYWNKLVDWFLNGKINLTFLCVRDVASSVTFTIHCNRLYFFYFFFFFLGHRKNVQNIEESCFHVEALNPLRRLILFVCENEKKCVWSTREKNWNYCMDFNKVKQKIISAVGKWWYLSVIK